MFEKMMRGGPVKEKGVEAVEMERAATEGDAADRGALRNMGRRFGAKKTEDVDAPEGWKMGPIARMAARRLAEPGLRGRGF